VKRARFWIGIAVSLVCLALAFKDIRPGNIAEALSRANYVWLLPALGLTVLAQLGRAARWGILFYPRRDLHLGRLFSILSIGYLVSNVLPARLGDFARAYLISDAERIPVARSLSTIVVERAFDVLALVVFLVVLIPFVPLPPEIAWSGFILGVAFAVALIGLMGLSWQQERSLRWIYQILVRLPRLDAERWTKRARSLIDGFGLLRAGRPLAEITGWSLAVWLMAAVTYFALMQAFALRLPFTAAVLVLCALGVSAIIPSSPGYIGVFHLAVVSALSLFAIEKDQALSYAIVLHGLNYVTLVGLGTFYALRESVSIWRLEKLKVEGWKVEG
jgi:uncharacterized protein (TIRG00374 family)